MFRKIFSIFSAVALIFYFSNPIQAAEDDGLDEFDDIVEVELNLDDDVDDGLDEFDDDDSSNDDNKEAEKLDGDDMVKIDPTYTENYSDEYYSDDEYSEFEDQTRIQPTNYVRVAVIIDTPGGAHYEPEAVYKYTQLAVKNILASHSELQMLPLENVDAYVQIYREEKGIDLPVADETTIFTRFALKRANLIELGDLLKAKYIFYVRVTSSMQKFSAHMLKNSKRANVITDFRIWSQDKKNFVYAKRYVVTTSSRAFLVLFSGSSYHAVSKGVKKAFSKIEADLPQLQAAIRN